MNGNGKTNNPNSIEPIILLLAFMIIVYSMAIFVAEKMFPNDGQIFQVMASLLSGFAGALMTRVKPKADPPPDSTTTTATANPPTVTTETHTTQ